MKKIELIRHLQKLGIKTQKNKLAKKDIASALRKIISAEDPKNSKIVKDFEKKYKIKVAKVKYIPPSGTLKASTAAENEIKKEGYTLGSMCRDAPIGFAKDFGRIAKWDNLSPEDILELQGVLLSEDFREGGVYIAWFEI